MGREVDALERHARVLGAIRTDTVLDPRHDADVDLLECRRGVSGKWRPVRLTELLPEVLERLVQLTQRPFVRQVAPRLEVAGIDPEVRRDLARHPGQPNVRRTVFGISATDIRMNAREPDLL